MATYAELQSLYSDNDLTIKVQVAVVIAAYDLVKTGEIPTQSQQNWAASVLESPGSEATKALKFILAKNSSATVAQITGATDATVQSNVNEVVPSLVAAHAGV